MTSGDAFQFDRTNFCPFIGDTANAAEGLRKLALNYKDTMQGRLDLEKYRSISKGAIKSFDPRFRRTRIAQSYDSTTKSETKVQSPFHRPKTGNTSLPTVSSMPSSPKRSPRKKNKCTIPRMRSQTLDGKLQRGSSFIDRREHKDSILVDTGTWADLSPPGHKKVESCDEQTETKEYISNRLKSQNVSGDSVRTLDMYTTPPLEIKSRIDEMMSKGVLTVPFARGEGICVNCACDFENEHNSLNCNASMADTNTIIQALTYASEKHLKKDPWYITWGLHIFGCFCGLVLVTCFAWVVTNDRLWYWVNAPKPPPPKVSPVYSFILTCGGSLIFTINLVVSTVYKIISLPRNSVFGSADDEMEDTWT